MKTRAGEGVGAPRERYTHVQLIEEIVSVLKRVILFLDRSGRALCNCQADSGLWHNVLNQPFSAEETSCSVIITFIYSSLINQEYLPKEFYLPMIRKARNGIMEKFWRGYGSGNCRGSWVAYHNPSYYLRRPHHLYVMPLIAPALIESAKALSYSDQV